MHVTKQMARFLFVGIFTNVSLYMAYLYITYLGLDHKYAMTLVYITGVVMGFLLNKQWTFQHNGHVNKVFIRYVLLYFFGYFANLSGLYFFVDVQSFPHQFVQLAISIFMAFVFFVMQRHWVFKIPSREQSETKGNNKISMPVTSKKRKKKKNKQPSSKRREI